jgi:hypothetical protein
MQHRHRCARRRAMGSARARLSKSVHQRSLGAGPWTSEPSSPSTVSSRFVGGLLLLGRLLPTIAGDRPVVPHPGAAALLFEPLHRIGLAGNL